MVTPENNLTFDFAGATHSWTVSAKDLRTPGKIVTAVYGPVDLLPASTGTAVRYGKAPMAYLSYLDIDTPTLGSAPFNHMRLARVGQILGAERIFSCLLGTPIAAPRISGSRQFTSFSVGGLAARTLWKNPIIEGYDLTRSIVSVDLNAATRQSTLTITLIGRKLPFGTTDFPLGSFVGTGTFDPVTGHYYGTDWASPPSLLDFEGQFSGNLYGASGDETGFALWMAFERTDSVKIEIGALFTGR